MAFLAMLDDNIPQAPPMLSRSKPDDINKLLEQINNEIKYINDIIGNDPVIKQSVEKQIVKKTNDMSFEQAQLICEGIISEQELIDTFGRSVAKTKLRQAEVKYERYKKRKIIEDKIPIEIKSSPDFNIDAYINDENDMEVR